MHMNCCMSRQNCLGSVGRKDWVHISNTTVPILKAYGLQLPLGNTNFHRQTYRTCRLNEKGDWPYCP